MHGSSIICVCTFVQVQSKVIWNSSNSAIMGFALTSDDFAGLHDIYEAIELGQMSEDHIRHPVYVEGLVFKL